MPELPEVENVAVALRESLHGRKLRKVQVRRSSILADPSRVVRRRLCGRRLTGVHRHGKYIIMHFDDRRFWMLHLRMTGQIFVREDYRPDRHVHLVLDFDGRPVHYRDVRRFGRFQLVDDGFNPSHLSHVGPDMLQVRFAEWYERIARRRIAIKTALLDQGIAAGIGNIYADESLFRAGVHPLTRPANMGRDRLCEVLRAAKGVLRLAIRHGGTTFMDFADFHGRPGNFRRRLRVYGRKDEPCLRCGTALVREVVGGRSTCFCPNCQT